MVILINRSLLLSVVGVLFCLLAQPVDASVGVGNSTIYEQFLKLQKAVEDDNDYSIAMTFFSKRNIDLFRGTCINHAVIDVERCEEDSIVRGLIRHPLSVKTVERKGEVHFDGGGCLVLYGENSEHRRLVVTMTYLYEHGSYKLDYVWSDSTIGSTTTFSPSERCDRLIEDHRKFDSWKRKKREEKLKREE